jgi:hypothetical protein
VTDDFDPSEEQRRTVRAMSGFGLPEADIAVLIDVDLATLREHFRRDLTRGAAEGTAKVAQSLFTMATREMNVTAMIFWMKARAGWRERFDTTHQLLGADGEPVDLIDTRPTPESFLLEWATPGVEETGRG